jgi:hypothetical protein
MLLLLSLLLFILPACEERSSAAPTQPAPSSAVRWPAATAAGERAEPTRDAPLAVAASVIPTPTRQSTFHVAADGSDEEGLGTADRPWASIAYAVAQVPDQATIVVAPGVYHGQVALQRRFTQGVVVRAAQPYQARLEYDKTVVTCYTCAGITLEGFEIAHDGEGADRYVIQIQDIKGDGRGGQRVTLRNNVIHDSRNNDLVKINNGAGDILLSANIFYNMGGPHRDSHLDVNSATNVVVEDNIFFNDFRASNRANDHDTGSFLVIKDSNGDDDANLGSHHVTVRRNIFLNWQGDEGNTFIVVGEDAVDYFQATDVLIENNLMLGNASDDMMQAAFQVRGSRDVTFRHNTVAGDLPSKAFAMRLARADGNPRNQNIAFYNNIWSDPTGTMGAEDGNDAGVFAVADPDDTESVVLHNNLYWNGGAPLPVAEDALVNADDDDAAVVGDPALGRQEAIRLPLWLREENQFADGSKSVREAFMRLVTAYGTPGTNSAALDAADPAYSVTDDILGRPRPAGATPDIGAVEG